MTNDDIAMLRRNRWLAIRNTPRKVGTERYLHVSAPLWEELDKDGKPTGKLLVGPGTTYRRPK